MIKESQLKDLNAFEWWKIDLDETGIINIGTGCWLILLLGGGSVIALWDISSQFPLHFVILNGAAVQKTILFGFLLELRFFDRLLLNQFKVLLCVCWRWKQCYVLKACLLTFSVH